MKEHIIDILGTPYRHTVERHDKLGTFAGVFGNVHMGGS